METKSEPYIRDVWYWFELNRMRLKVSWVGPSVLRIKAECSELGIDELVGHLERHSGEWSWRDEWRWRDGFAEFASRFSDRNCHAITEYLETHPVPEDNAEAIEAAAEKVLRLSHVDDRYFIQPLRSWEFADLRGALAELHEAMKGNCE